MNKNTALKIAKPYFETYPTVNEFHFTADEQAFQDKTHAANHAKTFKEKENQVVISVTRDEVIEASEVKVAPLIVSVPDGATVNVTNPETVNVVTDTEAQNIVEEAAKHDASDTTPVETEDVKPTAESIDEKEPAGEVVTDIKTKAAKAPRNKRNKPK